MCRFSKCIRQTVQVRQLVSRQGCGKIRHLSGKILWVRSKIKDKEVELVQVPTSLNVSDIGTKALSRKRLLGLMAEAGMLYVETGEPIGEQEHLKACQSNFACEFVVGPWANWHNSDVSGGATMFFGDS